MADKSSAKSLADPLLLETIDKLFQHNIGEYVSLPQLLVVGDQSSGKSSVLEGLTDLPFPRDSGLCTRFATHITFRRSATTENSVSILPAANVQPDHAEKLKRYHAVFETLDQPTFGKILREVHKLMALKESGISDAGADTFSDDVLKIEICSPEQQHLSVIDVPGIFRNTIEGMTTDSDIDIVRNMVNRYMKNPRSVILAVVPANVDIATQEILKMAEKCDTKGERTLGVLTKPDLVDRGAENRVVDLVEGRSHKLKLGWSIVKNSGQLDLEDPTFDRHSSEKEFFKSKEPWARLQKDRVGVGSLQGQLRDILMDMVKKEFPNVKSDINKRLNERKKQLQLLGPSRETPQQQHEYLLNLATKFQNITLHALAARYGADGLFESTPGLKLATMVVDRSATFVDDVWKKGHTMTFISPESEGSEDYNDQNDDDVARAPDVRSHRVRYTESDPDLDGILHSDREVPFPKPTGMASWLQDVCKSSRGFEPGTCDAALFPVIWRKQSTNWDNLALGYVSDIVSHVHNFILALTSAICENQRVQSALMSMLIDGLVDRYQKSIDHAKFIISVEKDGTPLTTNHHFADDLKKYRQLRTKARPSKPSFDYTDYPRVVEPNEVLQSSTADKTNHTVRDLHDILKSYYKVARKRFVDVVCMQAVDRHLITGPDTPIKLFSPSFVSRLSEDQLDRIAGEDVSTKKHREELRRQIENLTNGKKILV